MVGENYPKNDIPSLQLGTGKQPAASEPHRLNEWIREG